VEFSWRILQENSVEFDLIFRKVMYEKSTPEITTLGASKLRGFLPKVDQIIIFVIHITLTQAGLPDFLTQYTKTGVNIHTKLPQNYQMTIK
jgi:hypothetical protein